MESLGDVQVDDDNFLKIKHFTAACCCAEALTSAQAYLEADLAPCSSSLVVLPSCPICRTKSSQHHQVLTRTEHLQPLSVLPAISTVFGKP